MAKPTTDTVDAAVSTHETRFDNKDAQNNPLADVGGERAPLTGTDARDRRRPGSRDALYISERDAADMSIDLKTKQVVYIRDPEEYGNKDAGRMRRFRNDYESGEVVTVKGKTQGHRDLIICTVDKTEWDEMHTAPHQEACDQIERKIHSDEELEIAGVSEFRQDERSLKHSRAESRQKFGVMTGNTHYPSQMSYQQIVGVVGKEAIQEMERKAARGGRTEIPGEYERYAERKAKEAKGRTVSAPGRPTK